MILLHTITIRGHIRYLFAMALVLVGVRFSEAQEVATSTNGQCKAPSAEPVLRSSNREEEVRERVARIRQNVAGEEKKVTDKEQEKAAKVDKQTKLEGDKNKSARQKREEIRALDDEISRLDQAINERKRKIQEMNDTAALLEAGKSDPEEVMQAGGMDPGDASDFGWGSIVWEQDNAAASWLIEEGQEWRNRPAIVTNWNYFSGLGASARSLYEKVQSEAASRVEFKAGPQQATLKPYFDYTRLASCGDESEYSPLEAFIEKSSVLRFTLVNASPVAVCLFSLSPSPHAAASRVSRFDPVYIAPNGVPTTVTLETLPGVLQAPETQVSFGIGNCADMESRHAQFRLVGFKVKPPQPEGNQSGGNNNDQQPEGSPGSPGQCPPGTHMEQLGYREGAVEENPYTGFKWQNKENAWSFKARPHVCIPNGRWHVPSGDGVIDVCELYGGNRAGLLEHNTEHHPSGIEWGVEPADFNSRESFTIKIKNNTNSDRPICKCKKGWKAGGDVCEPACLKIKGAIIAQRGTDGLDPVCRCQDGHYFDKASLSCKVNATPSPCPKNGGTSSGPAVVNGSGGNAIIDN